jgi:hypothetical protein
MNDKNVVPGKPRRGAILDKLWKFIQELNYFSR